MRENVKNAVIAWGSGFVTATTFGAVVPNSPHIGVPRGTSFAPCSVVRNIGVMETTLRKVARKGAEKSKMATIPNRQQLVLERVREVRKRLKNIETQENRVV